MEDIDDWLNNAFLGSKDPILSPLATPTFQEVSDSDTSIDNPIPPPDDIIPPPPPPPAESNQTTVNAAVEEVKKRIALKVANY